MDYFFFLQNPKNPYFQCIFGIIYPQNLSFFNKNPVRQFFTPKAPWEV